MISSDDIHKAIDRIARSHDGYLLYLHFQKALCAVSPDSTSECALPRLEGRRSFAAELMALMAEGIRDSGRPSDPALTFSLAGPRAVTRPGGAGRRVTPDTAVAGWDAPAEPGPGDA